MRQARREGSGEHRPEPDLPAPRPPCGRGSTRPRLSPIWLVPVIAAPTRAWLVWDAMAKRGPLITVTFQSAEGLPPGQSHLRHLDVDLGLVERVALNPDMAERHRDDSDDTGG